MSTEAKAVSFCLCPECSFHGHVVCADGSTSIEFATPASGYQTLIELIHVGKITSGQALAVGREIAESPLDPINADVDNVLWTHKDDPAGLASAIADMHDAAKRMCGEEPHIETGTRQLH